MVDSSASAEKDKKGLFDKIKSVVPPLEERRKLVPLSLMFFAILFNYTILRDTKDVLMITAPKSGAEVIPFIKTYVNLPAGTISIIHFFPAFLFSFFSHIWFSDWSFS